MQVEISDLRDVVLTEAVTPFVQSLRDITDLQLGDLSRADFDRAVCAVLFVGDRDWVAVDQERQVVVDSLSGWKVKFENDVLLFIAGVAETVVACETNFVRAVPEQSFLAMLEIKINVDPAAFERQLGCLDIGPGFVDELAVFHVVAFFGNLNNE